MISVDEIKVGDHLILERLDHLPANMIIISISEPDKEEYKLFQYYYIEENKICKVHWHKDLVLRWKKL